MKKYLKNNNKAVAYCRLSIDDKDKIQSNSIENQIKLINEYCDAHELNLIDVYIDDGYSGSNFDRPSFQLMINDMYEKKFNCIITKDLSRLGRNYIQVGKYLDEIFAKNCIRYISISDNYDSSINEDDSIVINNICNTLYLKDCRKKAIQTFDRKASKQDLFIRKYGYKLNEENQVVIDEEVYPHLRLIMDSYLEYKSLKKVTEILRQNQILTRSEYHLYKKGKLINPTYNWDTAMVSNILKDYEYCGHAINMPKRKNANGEYIINQDVIIMKKVRPVIFTEEEYTKAKIIGKQNHTFMKNTKDDHLSKKVYYKENGRSMTFVNKRKGHKAVYKNLETGKSIYANELHKLLYLDIKDMIEYAHGGKEKLFNYMLDKYESIEDKDFYQEIKKEKEKADSLIEQLFEQKLEGTISEEDYQNKINELNAIANYLDNQIVKCGLTKVDEKLIKNKVQKIYDKIMSIKETTNKIHLINTFIKKVIIDVDTKKNFEIEIVYY